MFTLVTYLVVAVACFAAGLLVGRKNPSIADAVAKVANTAKADVNAAIAAHKTATGVPVTVSVGPTGPSGVAG
jgi:hypothetical protein